MGGLESFCEDLSGVSLDIPCVAFIPVHIKVECSENSKYLFFQ